MVLFEPEPDYSDVEPFARCAACRQSFKLETVNARLNLSERDCPSCAARLGRDEIQKSFEAHVKMTRGVRSAKEVIGGDWIYIFTFGAGLALILVGYIAFGKAPGFAYSIFLFSTLILVFGYLRAQKWLDRHSYFWTDDEEFNYAKREMKRSRLMWVTGIILNLILWLIYIKFL